MRWPATLLGVLLLSACAPVEEVQDPLEPSAAPVVIDRNGPERRFRYLTIDGDYVGDETFRGRNTVIAFVATYDTASQAQARFLRGVIKSYTPRVNAMLLVLESPENLPMVAAFASALEISFPVAFADEATIAGRGVFEGLHHVPSVVVLDRDGREVWRHLGLRSDRQIMRVLDQLD